jgi:predicted nucleic acid-binding protein
MILLDTDVMIDLLRQYPPAVTWLGNVGEEEIVLPGFVVMELIQGCSNSAEQEKVEKNLRGHNIVWPSSGICNEALLVFARYHLSHKVGLLDSLIGQLAVSLNLPLYTFNQKHYSVIPELKTMQPYQKAVSY